MGVNGIYGLSGSGLDVESMVKVGMLSKQSEYEKMQQKYTVDEWKKTEMLSLYGEIQTFNASTLSKYKMSSNMNSRSAASANSSVVTATANANAATMTHYVEVQGMASSAYLIGQNVDRLNTDSDYKNQLSSLLFKSVSENTETGITTITMADDTTFTVDNKDKKNITNATFNEKEVAFAFSINDGVNGMLASDNSDVVVASATPDAATGTYKVEITALAKEAITTGSTRLGGTKDSPVYSFFYDGSVKYNELLKQNATNTNNAVTLTFGDGTNTATIGFTFKDFNGSVESFVENLNKQFKDSGLTLEADYVQGTDTTVTSSGVTKTVDTIALTLKNTQGEGFGKQITIANKSINTAILGTDARSNVFANNLFLGNTDPSTTQNEDFFKRVRGADAKVKITDVTGGTTNELIDTSNYNTKEDYDTLPVGVKLDGNNVTVNGLTVTAKKTTTGIEIKNDGSQNIEVTYGELLSGFTFNDLTSNINSRGLNVRANYDSVQDRFTFYNKNSGEENKINIEIGTDTGTEKAAANATTFFNALGLRQSENGELVGDTKTFAQGETLSQVGKNSYATIDGVKYTLDSNNITVDGVTYKLQNVNTGSKVAVTVTQDAESIVKNVQSFVDDYNALLTKLYKWYDEKPNSDYKPLTESQKSGMKEEQIEKWEAKAKAGMLYHDKTLGNIITELRSAVSENVDSANGKYKNVFSIGISTTGIKGQLTLDKDQLRNAIAEDPDAVYNIFARLDEGEKQYKLKKDGEENVYVWSTSRYRDGYEIVQERDTDTGLMKDVTRTVERASYNGIAQRLGDVFMASMKSVRAVSGSTADVTEDSELNNLMRELQTKMSNFKRMMQAFETRLYKKYDAMESSLALLGSQLNYVTSAFQ